MTHTEGCGGTTVEDDKEVWGNLGSQSWDKVGANFRHTSLSSSSVVPPQPSVFRTPLARYEKNWLANAHHGKVNNRL